jgi:hypothetical protein
MLLASTSSCIPIPHCIRTATPPVESAKQELKLALLLQLRQHAGRHQLLLNVPLQYLHQKSS